jgi:hypothetical protein
VLVNSHRGHGASGDDSTQSNTVGRSGGKPHNKLVGNGADSDDDFIPATSTAQEATISHISTPSNFIESSHTKQGHCMPAGVCWKKLCRGGWCAS